MYIRKNIFFIMKTKNKFSKLFQYSIIFQIWLACNLRVYNSLFIYNKKVIYATEILAKFLGNICVPFVKNLIKIKLGYLVMRLLYTLSFLFVESVNLINFKRKIWRRKIYLSLQKLFIVMKKSGLVLKPTQSFGF